MKYRKIKEADDKKIAEIILYSVLSVLFRVFH